MINTIQNLQEDIHQENAEKIRGELIFPDIPEYENKPKVYNAMIDKKPGLIVNCFDVADVMKSVDFRRNNNILIHIL